MLGMAQRGLAKLCFARFSQKVPVDMAFQCHSPLLRQSVDGNWHDTFSPGFFPQKKAAMKPIFPRLFPQKKAAAVSFFWAPCTFLSFAKERKGQKDNFNN